MPLPPTIRRPDGPPAVVQSIEEFQCNFNIFSESSLSELDWSNVVAAGSSVVNTLLPVPEEYSRTKRGLREFYHEKFCPASDVDMLLYGLTEEQAIEKIKAIEAAVRDAVLTRITVVRTKHAITINSKDTDRGETEGEVTEGADESDGELVDGSDSEAEGKSMATGLFAKVKREEAAPLDDAACDDNEDEPDFYDINLTAWDTPCSALHLAVVNGHVHVVQPLVQEYGADVLLPVKFDEKDALLILVLALTLPVEKAKEMTKTLVSLEALSLIVPTSSPSLLFSPQKEKFTTAMNSDLETIKVLTLASWTSESGKDEAPLKIAVYDQNSKNPFSLAYSRGHYDAAKAFLEIAHAQYAPEDKSKTRYTMDHADEYSDYSDDDDASTSSDEGRPTIYSHIVDNVFTIENVGEVSMKVDSRTKPLQMVDWMAFHRKGANRQVSPLRAAILDNDTEKLKFLLDIYEHWTAQALDAEDEVSGFYSFPIDDFKAAIEGGHVELLGETIRRTGAGLPLESMVKNAGVELQVEPRWYQGSAVYGKKRKDWAEAGPRGGISGSGGTQTSPLLIAAFAGHAALSFTPKAKQLRPILDLLDPATHSFRCPRSATGWKRAGADPAIIRAVVDFDPSLLCIENAVGRTPAEVAHDCYPCRFRPGKPVTWLATASPFELIKPKVCDEPRDHETAMNVAKNRRFCAEVLARNGQPRRTLVGLGSANLVAKRLARRHVHDRYNFRFVEKEQDEAVASEPAESEDDISRHYPLAPSAPSALSIG
ncbi:hypothetical protein L209DRAFT_746264 [Thermothelomyces heterothallicus CBS 203.75]